MSADLVAFVDSNVLVYAVSKDEPEKQDRARMIVGRGFAEGCFAISTQTVLSEDLADGHVYGGITVENPFGPRR